MLGPPRWPGAAAGQRLGLTADVSREQNAWIPTFDPADLFDDHRQLLLVAQMTFCFVGVSLERIEQYEPWDKFSHDCLAAVARPPREVPGAQRVFPDALVGRGGHRRVHPRDECVRQPDCLSQRAVPQGLRRVARESLRELARGIDRPLGQRDRRNWPDAGLPDGSDDLVAGQPQDPAGYGEAMNDWARVGAHAATAGW